MVKVVNNCVDCPMGCIHCGREHEIEYYCDKCGSQEIELYDYYGEYLCLGCLIEKSRCEVEEC